MKIIKDFPPNIEEIRKVFPLSGTEIFCWGDIIYSPLTESLPIWLIAHEDVHRKQQGDEIEAWWASYLVSAAFRFDQELEAHQIEYQVYCQQRGVDRKHRRVYLKIVARKLSSAIYGRIITFEKAKKLIKQRTKS